MIKRLSLPFSIKPFDSSFSDAEIFWNESKMPNELSFIRLSQLFLLLLLLVPIGRLLWPASQEQKKLLVVALRTQ